MKCAVCSSPITLGYVCPTCRLQRGKLHYTLKSRERSLARKPQRSVELQQEIDSLKAQLAKFKRPPRPPQPSQPEPAARSCIVCATTIDPDAAANRVVCLPCRQERERLRKKRYRLTQKATLSTVKKQKLEDIQTKLALYKTPQKPARAALSKKHKRSKSLPAKLSKKVKLDPDEVETSHAQLAVPDLVSLFSDMRTLLGKPVVVLDPCYSKGAVKQHYTQPPFLGLVTLIHEKEMSKDGSFSEANLSKYKKLDFNIIVTNPPWSVSALIGVLSVLRDLALSKNVPLLFLLPNRCVCTAAFLSLFDGTTLRYIKIPDIPFHNSVKKSSSELSWYGFNIQRDGWNVLHVKKP
jgi:hypothetical protein